VLRDTALRLQVEHRIGQAVEIVAPCRRRANRANDELRQAAIDELPDEITQLRTTDREDLFDRRVWPSGPHRGNGRTMTSAKS
jgi:hypothetical protein